MDKEIWNEYLKKSEELICAIRFYAKEFLGSHYAPSEEWKFVFPYTVSENNKRVLKYFSKIYNRLSTSVIEIQRDVYSYLDSVEKANFDNIKILKDDRYIKYLERRNSEYVKNLEIEDFDLTVLDDIGYIQILY